MPATWRRVWYRRFSSPRAEALALKPTDVNLDDGDIRVLHSKGDRSRTIGIDQGALVHLSHRLIELVGRRVTRYLTRAVLVRLVK